MSHKRRRNICTLCICLVHFGGDEWGIPMVTPILHVGSWVSWGMDLREGFWMCVQEQEPRPSFLCPEWTPTGNGEHHGCTCPQNIGQFQHQAVYVTCNGCLRFINHTGKCLMADELEAHQERSLLVCGYIIFFWIRVFHWHNTRLQAEQRQTSWMSSQLQLLSQSDANDQHYIFPQAKTTSQRSFKLQALICQCIMAVCTVSIQQPEITALPL